MRGVVGAMLGLVACGRFGFDQSGSADARADATGDDTFTHAGCVSQLVVGNEVGCVLLTDHTVSCWGANQYGTLGDGSTMERHAPALVPGLTDVIAIGGGMAVMCAIRADHSVWCWGQNDAGQLGAATAAPMQLTPIQIPGVTDAVAVRGGRYHVCITTSADVLCWGQNDQGQLGDGSMMNSAAPVAAGIASPLGLAGGTKHTCARSGDGTVRCWGDNRNGQLSIDTGGTSMPSPVQVTGTPPLTSVTADLYHTCATADDGSAWCWGYNVTGQLGDGTTTSRAMPAPVPSPQSFVEIGTGGFLSPGPGAATCARTAGGEIWCWGWNQFAQLGNGDTVDQHLPVQVMGIADADLLAVGGASSCARLRSGEIMCWGRNSSGALGAGNTTAFTTPQRALLSCP